MTRFRDFLIEGLEQADPQTFARYLLLLSQTGLNETKTGPLFAAMASDPLKSVALARFLDEHFGEWEQTAEARDVLPGLISHMLADPEALFEMQTRADRINPDWMASSWVTELKKEWILALVSPHADIRGFAERTLPLIDPRWRESTAAGDILPLLCERDVQEANRPAGSERYDKLLKELSPVYWGRCRLTGSTGRMFWSAVVLVVVVLFIKGYRSELRKSRFR